MVPKTHRVCYSDDNPAQKRRRRHNGTTQTEDREAGEDHWGRHRHHDQDRRKRARILLHGRHPDRRGSGCRHRGWPAQGAHRGLPGQEGRQDRAGGAAPARQPRVLRHLPPLAQRDARRGHVLHADLRARHPRDDGQPEGAARHASGGRPRVRGIHPQPRGEHGRHDPRRLRPHARHPGRERARRYSRRERI